MFKFLVLLFLAIAVSATKIQDEDEIVFTTAALTAAAIAGGKAAGMGVVTGGTAATVGHFFSSWF